VKKRLIFKDFNNVKAKNGGSEKESWLDKNTVKKLNKRLIFN